MILLVKKDMMNRILVVVAIVAFSFSNLVGQFNFKIGIAGAYMNSEKNTSILKRFDQNNPQFTDGFEQASLVYGLQGGVRYTLGDLSLDLNYHNYWNTVEASGRLNNDEIMMKSLYYTAQHLDFGFEHHIMNFGYGATIGYSFLDIKSNTNLDKDKVTVFKDNVLSSQFFVTWYISRGDIIGFALRPFVEISWDNYYLGKLDKNLNPSSTIVGTALKDKIQMFGLSFIIYNGVQ